jgi:DNA uptake protein ComE-like DNA-binding protein
LRPFGNDRSKPFHILGQFLNYSRAEKRGIVFLLFLILVLLALPEVVSSFYPPSGFQLTIQPFGVADSNTVKTQRRSDEAPEIRSLHDFDPNSVRPETLMKFGVPQPVARRIKNYLGKGGRFRKPEDLLRIWGMDTLLFVSLKPFIRIPEMMGSSHGSSREHIAEAATLNAMRKVLLMDLNAADSAALIRLPGIGEKLAARIVAYRERLGGFAHIDQLFEVYGLPRETALCLYQEGRLGLISGVYRKIQINTCKAAALKHPYITKTQANALLAYRQQHGPFKDSSDMQSVLSFSAAEKTRLIPYLDFRRN